MFVPVHLRMGGEELYARAFRMLEARAEDLTVPLEAIGELLIENVGRQFASEGAFAGSSWRPLTDRYARWKEQHYPGRPLLVRTAGMRQMMLDRGQSLTVEPFRMVYEPPSEIPLYHQEGTSRMPARPLVMLPDSELHEIDRIFARWLAGVERGPAWAIAGVGG